MARDVDLARSTRNEVLRLAGRGLDWVTFATRASEVIGRAVPFGRSCWHTVDPGTVLFTGNLNHRVGCSGSWLAEHEYVVDDVNKWWFLARSGQVAGATSLATCGDLTRSARHRSHEAFGIGDELRGSFVADGTYWGAAGFLRDEGEPSFTESDVRLLALLGEPLAAGFRRALLVTSAVGADDSSEEAPGVVVFDESGAVESLSSTARHWIAQMVEVPPPVEPAESAMIRIVAARARSLATAGEDPLRLAARSRVQTESGRWLLLYGTQLSGGADDPDRAGGPGGTAGRIAVIIQPAPPNEVVPLVAMAYGLSDREQQVTRLCMKGRSTRQIAQTLRVSPYTVQDHLKSIFDKTGVRNRGELVGQVFLEHYVPLWQELPGSPEGWCVVGATPRRR